MATSQKELRFLSDQSWIFETTIEKFDLTQEIYKLSIITSTEIPYQTFELEFVVDPNDIILEQIHGQKPIKINMTHKDQGTFPDFQEQFELLPISLSHPTTVLVENPENTQKQLHKFTVTAISRKPYKIMNTFVNDVFQGSTVETVISSLVSKCGAKVKYDINDRNTEQIDQILIPPTSLYQALKYINRTWGIFNGIPAIFCNDDTVYIKNLTKKMVTSQEFTIWQLASDSNNENIVADSGINTFYTKDNVEVTYDGNTIFGYYGPTIRNIVKPRNTLSSIIDINLENFAKKYGLISKQDKIFHDNKALLTDKRITIQKDHTGYDLSETYINANLSKEVANLSEMMITVSGNIDITKLVHVGEAVQFNSNVLTSKDYTGKYILKGSTIQFTKGQEWNSAATLLLTRTNKTIS